MSTYQPLVDVEQRDGVLSMTVANAKQPHGIVCFVLSATVFLTIFNVIYVYVFGFHYENIPYFIVFVLVCLQTFMASLSTVFDFQRIQFREQSISIESRYLIWYRRTEFAQSDLLSIDRNIKPTPMLFNKQPILHLKARSREYRI
jgi:hypothetical protein